MHHNIQIIVQNQLSQWDAACPGGRSELSTILVWFKYVSDVVKDAHWTTKGTNFYGDHLMFERVYESIYDMIDPLAEKVIGLSCEKAVDLQTITSQVSELVASDLVSQTQIPTQITVGHCVIKHLVDLIELIDTLMEQMRQRGGMTRGVDNMLSGFLDKLEENVYLIKQQVLPNG